jgi:hypothetical protein
MSASRGAAFGVDMRNVNVNVNVNVGMEVLQRRIA